MENNSSEIDHLFLFVSDAACAAQMMADAGLRVNYSRKHPGQGTQNLCACLDDIFLELLWLDGSAISQESERITLGARGRGVGSPIGIAWRGVSSLECEDYAAPFLPENMTISVARASLDPVLPFFFRTPDGTKPIDRSDGLVGARQTPDLSTLGRCELFAPNPKPVAALLAELKCISVKEGPYCMRLTLLDASEKPARTVVWPG